MIATDGISACAACGKDGDGLKACKACKLVKYCGVDCQRAHRPKHKKACKKRAAEIHEEALFQEHPPDADCPICFLPIIDLCTRTYKSCCGNEICDGCMYAMTIDGGGGPNICPFCREPGPNSAREDVGRVRRRMELGDAEAYRHMGGFYFTGGIAVTKDYKKAMELSIKAGELGSAMAYYNVGVLLEGGIGVEKDSKKANHYYELAAMMGSKEARHAIGVQVGLTRNICRSMKHFMIAARAGSEPSLDAVRRTYAKAPGIFMSKDEYEETLRAYHKIREEAKSEMREKAARYRKSNDCLHFEDWCRFELEKLHGRAQK